MRIYGRADTVTVESDESGFMLCVSTDEGDTFIFRIHHIAEDVATNVDSTIGAWRREGEDARATYVHPITDEDLEAYEKNDPKRITLERERNR